MPLWKFYHPVGAFTTDDKKALSQRITKRYSDMHIPAFYVGVVFQEVPKDSFYMGGEPADDFVRIWVDHIARTLPNAEMRTRCVRLHDEAIAPFIRDKGLRWEFHVDETSFELWSIQGYRPPPPGSDVEKKWFEENKPSAYEPIADYSAWK